MAILSVDLDADQKSKIVQLWKDIVLASKPDALAAPEASGGALTATFRDPGKASVVAAKLEFARDSSKLSFGVHLA